MHIRPAIKENTSRVIVVHQNNSELHAMILWCVISVKSIGQKMEGLEIITLNCEKM